MQALIIRHLTSYRYRHPVAFGEHRMMLRPRDSHDQKVVEARLEITPEPASLCLVQDSFGNHVAIADFNARAVKLSFQSIVSVERSSSVAANVDPAGFDLKTADPATYLQLLYPDPQDEVRRWMRRSLPALGSTDPLEFLTRLAQLIHATFLYRRREAKGIQPPLETLRLGQGTCRDFALLMIEAARAMGFAARFASGYLAISFEGGAEPEGAATVEAPDGATHAWAQVYVPDVGWLDFDPTSGTVGNASLITVAVVSDPYDALPLYGTYDGAPSDFLGMDVRVSITLGAT
jgi:transglutaminase-like putative cysteine protease